MQSTPQNNDDESDASLLESIGAADGSPEDQKSARTAQSKFFARHYEHLMDTVAPYAKGFGDVEIDTESLVMETFIKFFELAASFTDQSGGDRVRGRQQIRAWLVRTARNLACDAWRKAKRMRSEIQFEELSDQFEKPATETEGKPRPTSRAKLQRLEHVIASLKTEDQLVIQAYMLHGERKPNGAIELPKEVREALERSTGYERGYLRQKWHRLKEKLESELKPTVLPNLRQPVLTHA